VGAGWKREENGGGSRQSRRVARVDASAREKCKVLRALHSTRRTNKLPKVINQEEKLLLMEQCQQGCATDTSFEDDVHIATKTNRPNQASRANRAGDGMPRADGAGVGMPRADGAGGGMPRADRAFVGMPRADRAGLGL